MINANMIVYICVNGHLQSLIRLVMGNQASYATEWIS